MLRIVGGSLSGRRFKGPPGDATRPTSERVREALASALDARDQLRDARVLDLYAGTGALAFEALSRGAHSAVLVEQDGRVASAISSSARELGLGAQVEVLRTRLGRPAALRTLSEKAPDGFSLIFCDPPYADVEQACEVLTQLLEAGLLARDARIVLEHSHRNPPQLPACFQEQAKYRYGDTGVRIWSEHLEEP